MLVSVLVLLLQVLLSERRQKQLLKALSVAALRVIEMVIVVVLAVQTRELSAGDRQRGQHAGRRARANEARPQAQADTQF